jgi:type IV pilus assembly protein PilY1
MNAKYLFAVLILLLGAVASNPSRAQITFSEDFTGAASANSWYFFSGACLTAGSATAGANPGPIPGCASVLTSYYSQNHPQSNTSDPNLVGGNSGFLGSTTAPSTPDPVGHGALRFTNGYPYGKGERGAILSANTFNTGAGLNVTFKTITYLGDSGSNAHGGVSDGADGISFFLMDGSKPPGLGAVGGSLAYSCSNSNTPYDGLNGGYLGLGIDEYGNFLNGTNLVAGYTAGGGTNVATGDNAAYGYGSKGGRIGLRGAGNISWAALTAAYGTYQGNSLPYYPASLTTTYGSSTYSCASGTNNNNEFCWSCPATYASYPGAPSTPTGVVTGNATTCTYTLYSSVGSCPTSYTAYSGAPSSPAGTISFSGGHCVDTLYGSAGSCPTSYTAYSGAPSSPTGTISYNGTNCIDTVYATVASCPTSYTAYGAPGPGGTVSINAGHCRYRVSGTTYIGPATFYTGPATATYTGPSTATYTITPTTAPVTVTGGSGTTLALQAVQQACSTGNLYNYYDPAAPVNVTTATLTTSSGATNTANPAGILDYAPIPNAYKELTSFKIAAEGATTRNPHTPAQAGDATPIFYNLKITQDGLLSLSYSTGGAYSSLISNQSITAANGALPATFRVGFAGSTGGSTNVHEIMCFKAASADQSGSSATVNEKQAAKVEAGTQAYFAFYNPNDWTGTVTANDLIDTAGVITVRSMANWDASCWLTSSSLPAAGGGCAAVTGPPVGTPAPSSRVMLTWDTVNKVGIPFEWASLNAAQQAALTAGDPTPITANRLNYLRGDRSNEVNTSGAGLYRARDAVLGDIVDSSPAWVGPPSSPYTATWQDHLNAATVMPENAVAQSYLLFSNTEQTRQNVVYVGSNDGFLHGFRAGSFDVNGAFVATGNDGQEIVSYMPGSTLASAAASGALGGCTTDTTTGTLVQQIHGVTPAIGANPLCVEPLLDYSNTQYGHNFFVDATPGTGDLYFGGAWHTWLVGGLGTGGAAIYALDVTNPSYSEGGASSTVVGEWTAGSSASSPSAISCAIVSNCGNNLGNTFGTPQIRRLHNGNWGAIFGNGFGSQSGDAGIYVMSIDSGTGATTFYYLSTGVAGANGIAYVTPADLDGDHITDFVYAGDLQGNVWRFDLTSNNPANWVAGTAPMFTTKSGQPITSQLLVISSSLSGQQRLLIEFGTGQRTQLTNMAPVQYAAGTQSVYGVWDWNLTAWNAMAPSATYLSLPATNAATGLASPYTLSSTNLTAQHLTANANGTVDGTNAVVCWQGSSACVSGNTSFGWFADLPSSGEQIIFNPVFYQGAFLVNSTVPANNALASCTNNQDTGYTYALAVANGGVFTNTFPTFTQNGVLISDSIEAGVQTNATGSVYIVTTAERTTNIVYQTISGTPGAQKVNIPPNTKSKRLTWIERR